MTQRVYLDTSVFSALLDERAPDRMRLTDDFWNRRKACEVNTSEIARNEIADTRDDVRRNELLALLDEVNVLELTEEMRDLAHRYIRAGIFTIRVLNDALHVAAAVHTRHDVLLSWNFKHLVNRRRRAEINAVNVSLDLPTVDIITPPEL